jgi:pimeloyl-ACP methyl ester carboxylesterase
MNFNAVFNMMNRLFLIFTVFLFTSFFTSCMKFRTNDKQTLKFFEEKNQQVFITKDDNLRVIKTDTTNFDLAVLFIHGTPGSADAFFDYLADSSLLSKATLISYDRPGYGYSDYGNPMTSIKDQAGAILTTISSYKKVFVVGHSYGGPIAAYLAINSKNINGVVLIAPAMYPHKEKYYGMAKLGKSSIGRMFSSKALYVASLEKIDHQSSLKEIENEWVDLNCKLVHIHSRDDKIVPFDNVDYSKKMFTSAQVQLIELQEGNHFLPWNHYDLVKATIIELIE